MGDPSPQWIALVTAQILAMSLEERVRLAAEPDVLGSVAQRVAVEESHWTVAEAVAGNPATEWSVLRWLAFREDGSGGRVQRALAAKSGLDERRQLELLDDPRMAADPDGVAQQGLRAGLAANPATPSDVQRRLTALSATPAATGAAPPRRDRRG